MSSKFTLVKRFANNSVAKFHVLRGNDIVGSINIPPEEEADLLKCWNDAPKPKPGASAGWGIPALPRAGSMAHALLRSKARLGKAALLRAC